MSQSSISGLGVKPQPEATVNNLVWIVFDSPVIGLRITNGNKSPANINAGRYQAKRVQHPITPGRETLLVFDNEENPAYVVVQTLPGQGVNFTIEDIRVDP